jgi:hypothetical protein
VVSVINQLDGLKYAVKKIPLAGKAEVPELLSKPN